MNRFFVVGGAGFIGSHFVDALLENPDTEQVSIYDNFSAGKQWHYEHHLADNRLVAFNANIENIKLLTNVMAGNDVVILVASNPNIALASTCPTIDFDQGTVLANNVLEAMRQSGVKRLLFASGSGVYGECGNEECQEDRGPLLPISTYGASKLACEALIHSYCHMFDMQACAFRFANVVGARQTHGICYDFIKRLLKDPTKLTVLGDGSQSKSYVYVKDIVNAVLLANDKLDKSYEVYNVATKDYIFVSEITQLVIEHMGLSGKVNIEYTGGSRGWKGDVGIVRLSSERIRKLGWNNQYSTREAISKSILELLDDNRFGR